MFQQYLAQSSGGGQTQGTPRRSSVLSPDAAAMNGVGEGGRREEYVEGNLKLTSKIECGSEVMCVRYSNNGSHLAIGQADGIIKVCCPDTGQTFFSLSDDQTSTTHLPATSIRFRPTDEHSEKNQHRNMLMATYASGLVKFWHYTSGKCLQTINEGRQTLSCVFNPLGTKFVTCGADPQIRMYDVETKKRLHSMEASDSRDVMNGHRTRVYTMQYHPYQPHIFISGGWDDTIQFWDDRDKHAVRSIYGPHVCGDSLDIDPAHNHILSGSWRKENPLQIWDFDSGEKIKDVPQDSLHGSLLYCAQWLGRENILCGGCEQNMVRVIDRGTLNTVGQLVDLPGGAYCLDNDRQGSKPKMAVGAGKKTYIMKLEKKQI